MQRESFIIFKNWVEAINKLPENEQLETYKALTEFGFNGEMPQKISYIASALLTSFSIGLKNSQIRYENSVKNGKKGGRPKRAESSCETKEDNKDKSSSAIENDENADKKLEFQENPEKPRKTQENPEKPRRNLNDNVNVNENVNVNDNDNDNVNVNANVIDKQTVRQSINNKIYLSRLRGCEDKEKMKELFTENFKDFFPTRGYSEQNKRLFYEVIDVLITAVLRARKGNFRFQMETIDEEKLLYYISLLDGESIFRVVWQLLCNDTIVKRPPYILGACFNLAKEKLANTG